jgi:hypothetical protein
MSRSYRRPYASCCGSNSARWDKQQANRGIRRRVNGWIHRQLKNNDEFDLVPHRLECHHNEVYDWARDGHQYYHELTGNDWHLHVEANSDGTGWLAHDSWLKKHYGNWPPLWYQRLLRK